MLIRKAKIEDAFQIAKIQTATWRTTYCGIIADDFLQSLDIDDKMQSWQKRIDIGEQLIFVAEENDKIVGFSCAGKSREQNDYTSELYAIYILEEFHGKQIGRQLVRETAKELMLKNFTQCLFAY